MPKPKRRVGPSEYEVASEQAPAQFVHPADGMDGRATGDGMDRPDTSEAFRRLFQAMLPATEHCGGVRRFQSGYFRMCALSYRVGQDEFWPGMTQEDVAAKLGISYQAFKKHLALVDSFLRKSREL